METARTSIILRELFSFLLPSKIEVFNSSETINSTEKEVLEGLRKYVRKAKTFSAQKFKDSLVQKPLESFANIERCVEKVFHILFHDGTAYYKIVMFVIFCCDFIEHLDNSKLENPTQRVYTSCVERILTDLESWIQSDGRKWNNFRPSHRVRVVDLTHLLSDCNIV